MKRCMAFRTLLDAGVPAAAGSDFDPGPFSPLMGIQGMVTRTGWNKEVWGANQRITVDEALRVGAQWRLRDARESIKGSITRGKLTDFVMLAEDPHTVDAAKIKDMEIDAYRGRRSIPVLGLKKHAHCGRRSSVTTAYAPRGPRRHFGLRRRSLSRQPSARHQGARGDAAPLTDLGMKLSARQRSGVLFLKRHASIDTHSHPGRFFLKRLTDQTPTTRAFGTAFEDQAIADLSAGNVSAALFCAVADMRLLRNDIDSGVARGPGWTPGEAYADYRRQIGELKALLAGEALIRD